MAAGNRWWRTGCWLGIEAVFGSRRHGLSWRQTPVYDGQSKSYPYAKWFGWTRTLLKTGRRYDRYVIRRRTRKIQRKSQGCTTAIKTSPQWFYISRERQSSIPRRSVSGAYRISGQQAFTWRIRYDYVCRRTPPTACRLAQKTYRRAWCRAYRFATTWNVC